MVHRPLARLVSQALICGSLGLGLAPATIATAEARASVENNARALLAIECFSGSLDARAVMGFDAATYREHGHIEALAGEASCIVYPQKWPYGAPPPEAVYNDLWALGGGSAQAPRGYPVRFSVEDGKITECSGLEKFQIRDTWFARPICGPK